MTDIPKIAESLTPAQRSAVMTFGPDHGSIISFRTAEALNRLKLVKLPLRLNGSEAVVNATATGLAVRAHLMEVE